MRSVKTSIFFPSRDLTDTFLDAYIQNTNEPPLEGKSAVTVSAYVRLGCRAIRR